jgi:UDP-N-acetylglucosamine diphosphorylase/glucosamine-1-phosphate N-acetyltransferase
MDIILFEDHSHFDLLPFTYTRPVDQLRTGIYTNYERWVSVLGTRVYALAYGYLGAHFNQLPTDSKDYLWINGKYWPEPELLRYCDDLPLGSYARHAVHDEVVMARFPLAQLGHDHDGLITIDWCEAQGLKAETFTAEGRAFRFPEDLFLHNRAAIAFDFNLITENEQSCRITDPHTVVYGADNLFVGEGVQVRAGIINAEDGPIYLGPGVRIGEGAIIHGSHAFGAHTQVSMGAKLRGDSAFGPYVKVGGEVGNSVIMGYSNKGHDGYLGNSVLGHWCNLGADTNTSNLKNNYAEVKLYHEPSGRFRPTGQQFCGLMMGDHSKCGINTMFNTGTVVGVSANLFGAGFPRPFVPSFAWGGSSGLSTFRLDKAFEVAQQVMGRRQVPFDQKEQAILSAVYALTAPQRRWE